MKRNDEKVTESAEKKVKVIQSHPLITFILMRDVGKIIRSFCSISSVFPICSLFHYKPTGEFTQAFFLKKMFTDDLLRSIENIHLFIWYKWLRKRLGFKKRGMICYPLPYAEGTSKDEANLYFEWKGKSKEWKRIRGGEFYQEAYAEDKCIPYTDMTWLAESYGYIPLGAVPISYQNVLHTVYHGRWDLADKYMRRGDHREGVRDLIEIMFCRDIEKFIRRYDVQKEVFESDGNYFPETISTLLYGGIIIKKELTTTGYSSYLIDGEKRSRIPMNVLEDLFTLHARGAREGKSREPTRDRIYTLQRIFFDELLRDDKKINPMASRRVEMKAEVEEIILTLRGRNEVQKQDGKIDTSRGRTMALIMLSLYVGGEVTPVQRACVSLIGTVIKEVMSGMRNEQGSSQRHETQDREHE